VSKLVESLVSGGDTEGRLNSEMVRAFTFGMGIGQPPDVRFLRKFSLGEMLAARDCAKESNEAPAPCPDGSGKTLTMWCDDRFVAALYAALHYDPQNPNSPDPLVLLPSAKGFSALVHVDCPACSPAAMN
jgi:hypothetical protein